MSDGPVLTLVCNPNAGLGKANKLLPRVTAAIERAIPDANVRIHRAVSVREARVLTVAAAAAARPATDDRRADAVLVMGGDGMMHLGIQACAGTGVPIGLIPAGTGNDICRGFGLPSNDALAALDVIVRGHTRRVDLIKVRGDLVDGTRERHVASVVASGYDAKVNRRANHTSWPRGSARYAVAVFRELRVFEPLRYRVTIDGETAELPAMVISVANSRYFGGGIMIAPRADPADGWLDITLVHPVSRLTLIRLFAKLFSGKFVSDPAVEQLRAREIIIDGDGLIAMGDGEELGPVPVTLTNEPDALTIFTPN
ncbi:MAG: diacylglycerol kinase family lipid kinase [Propionibacterium sp.]|nr:diacylglycerol kinase family lipid kinase [Propionibacterium sp.]